jgi:hypothetical protein
VVGYDEGVAQSTFPVRSNYASPRCPHSGERAASRRADPSSLASAFLPLPAPARARRVGRGARKARMAGTPRAMTRRMVRHDRSALQTKCAASRGGTFTFYRDRPSVNDYILSGSAVRQRPPATLDVTLNCFACPVRARIAASRPAQTRVLSQRRRYLLWMTGRFRPNKDRTCGQSQVATLACESPHIVA